MSYEPARRDDPLHFVIASIDNREGVTVYATSPASAAYPLANLALFVPFSVPVSCVVLEAWAFCGTVAGGNFDVGIYDVAGTRLTSSGATARTASVPVDTTTMTNYTLAPGVQYYMAMSHDGTNNFFATSLAAGLNAAAGVLEATTAYVLPSSVTYAITTRAYVPYFGLNLQATGM